MSEGNPTSSAEARASRRRKLTILLGGTAVILLTAGVLMQIFRAAPGTAAEVQNQRRSAGQSNRQPNGSSSTNRPLARVNGELVSWREVARECVSRYGQGVLESIINRTIIQQACEKRGITITKKAVDQEVQKIAGRFNLPVDTWYKMLQAERNLTPEQYRRDIIWPMLALKELAGEKVKVTEKDIHRAFVRDFGEKVKAKMIMLDNFRRAKKVWEKATENPDDFERLARKYSVAQNSRPLGGAIPPIRRYSGNKELEEAAFKLEKGEVSGIIQVGLNRYVILLCEGRTKPVVNDLSKVRADLHQQLLEEKVQKQVAQMFEKLKKNARIDNFLTGTSTGKGEQTASTSSSAPNSVQPGQLRPGLGGQSNRSQKKRGAIPKQRRGSSSNGR